MRRFLLAFLLASMMLPLHASPYHAVAQSGTPDDQTVVALGDSGIIGDYSFVVDTFNPDASDLIDPAGSGVAPGKQLADITLTVTNDDKSVQAFPFINYLVAGNRGVLETVARAGVCDVKDSIWDYFNQASIPGGDSITYHLCSPIPLEDINSLRLGLDDYSGGPLHWFDLGNEANVDPQVAVDQAGAALNAVSAENSAFDEAATASAVISTGNLTGELLDYQPDATDDLGDAGMNAPVAGLNLAEVEIRITNIADETVVPVVELVGADGVGHESVHKLPAELEKDSWSIELLPGGQADMLFVFPVNANDAGNRLLYVGESPNTRDGFEAAGAWLNPGDATPEMPTLASVSPGITTDASDVVPFGARVTLTTVTLSVNSADFQADGSASIQILVENQGPAAMVVSPDFYLAVVGSNAPCEMQLYDGSTSTISDPIGMLAPNAATTLIAQCPAGVNDVIHIANYLVTAPDGMLNADFVLDPATAVASPEDTPAARDDAEIAGEQAGSATLSPAEMLIRLTDGNGFSLQDVQFDDFQFLNGQPVQDMDADMVSAYEDAGIIDLYITWDNFVSDDGDETYSVSSRIVTFGNDDDAAAYTDSLFDQVKANAGDDLKHLRLIDASDLPEIDGTIEGWQGEVRADSGDLQPYLRYVGQIGSVVFSVQVGGPSAEMNATVLGEMVTAQADCLATTSVCDPIPFPASEDAMTGRLAMIRL